MKTFDAFMGERVAAQRIAEAAELMVRVDDPCEFIQTWYEQNEPEVAALLVEAGFWQGLRDAGSQMMGGIRAAGQAFGRQMWGPQAKFDAAVKALSGLAEIMHKDPQLQGWAGSRPGMQLLDQVNRMIKYLGQMKAVIPQQQTQTATNTWAHGPQHPGNATAAAPTSIPHPAAATP
jgi:hypothetical protein